MEISICKDTRDYDKNEYCFMVTPCHWNGLAIKKEKEPGLYYSKCPICNSDIYIDNRSGYTMRDNL